jgi:ABC-type transporter Mla subunit MlaD
MALWCVVLLLAVIAWQIASLVRRLQNLHGKVDDSLSQVVDSVDRVAQRLEEIESRHSDEISALDSAIRSLSVEVAQEIYQACFLGYIQHQVVSDTGVTNSEIRVSGLSFKVQQQLLESIYSELTGISAGLREGALDALDSVGGALNRLNSTLEDLRGVMNAR